MKQLQNPRFFEDQCRVIKHLPFINTMVQLQHFFHEVSYNLEFKFSLKLKISPRSILNQMLEWDLCKPHLTQQYSTGRARRSWHDYNTTTCIRLWRPPLRLNAALDSTGECPLITATVVFTEVNSGDHDKMTPLIYACRIKRKRKKSKRSMINIAELDSPKTSLNSLSKERGRVNITLAFIIADSTWRYVQLFYTVLHTKVSNHSSFFLFEDRFQ